MDALSNFLGRELVKRIDDKREAYLGPLIAGQMVDYPMYRDRAGYLRGLADVLEMIKDINNDDDRRPDGFARQHEGGSRRTA
jgi:hypothetical protein